MATLQSPGTQVQVIDESFYTSAGPGTIPIVFVASAEDKLNPSGVIAQGTTAANAGKVWLITSQRDLTDTFGTPLFYTDTNNNPKHGDEQNEYGLQTAYSVLGAASRCYVVRADLDVGQMSPTSTIPNGKPVNGTYWVDTDASKFGVKEWSTATQKFTVKTPIVLDDLSDASNFDGVDPADSIGVKGEYCMIVTKDNTNTLYYKNTGNNWVSVVDGFGGGKEVVISPHYTYPAYTTATNGSVWITSTTPSNGANWSVKLYSSSADTWSTVSAPLYSSTRAATYALDPSNGGKNITVGSLFVETNYDQETAVEATFKLWRRSTTGATTIVSDASTLKSIAGTYTFQIRESLGSSWSGLSTVTITPASTTTNIGSLIPAALSGAGLNYITSTYNASTNKLTINHTRGGEFELIDGTATPLDKAGFVEYDMTTKTGTANLYLAPAGSSADFIATNWKPLVYEARATAPITDPADGTLWYDSIVDEVDILYHNGTTWVAYQDATAFPSTSPNGPIISASMPDKDTGQSDGTALVAGDIWVDTSDLEMYGRNIYIWSAVDQEWVLQDVTDQSTPEGWLFADARWGCEGFETDPATIADLLTCNYLDPDAPDPALYPRGMRLWNTRRSGFNVKKYIEGYLNLDANNEQNIRYGNESMANYVSSRWVCQNPVAEDGGPQFGRKAQRAQTVAALKGLIDSNVAVRDAETLIFNLIATPGYPEAIQNMVALNTDRGLSAFVVGDTPFRLKPTGTDLTAWGANSNAAFDNGEEGAVTYDDYMAMWYPSGYTNDNSGNKIVVPASHMILRTIINSDNKSYQWFAPAGTRRGVVDNASSAGYINAEGEFAVATIPQGIRDVLDDVKINPITTLTGVGLIAYGQRTRSSTTTSLDRINVARLVCYLRRQLDVLARPFLFEPNDDQTRREIKAAAESLMLELVGQRALNDFIVVCDETNNTPARIDRSELYMDIAIEPIKAVEFIYIPLRIKNTGDIKAGL
jgi:hypothetical protein